MSHRLEQINELIRHELNRLILTEIDFPKNCLVTIISINTSKDLRHAKVLISVLPAFYTKKVLAKLAVNAGHLQYLLNQRLSMRPLPRLAFRIDETEKKAAAIEELLDRIKKNG
ncbi:MAG: 30S ribosome-binding factor RbfA [Patescibacteria group bacterium]|nr:30S ribosome-binding factor RbfA [Patescibacteria group bacterium]